MVSALAARELPEGPQQQRHLGHPPGQFGVPQVPHPPANVQAVQAVQAQLAQPRPPPPPNAQAVQAQLGGV